MSTASTSPPIEETPELAAAAGVRRSRKAAQRAFALISWDVVVVLGLYALAYPIAGLVSDGSALGGDAVAPFGFEAILTAVLSVAGLWLAGSYRHAGVPGAGHGFARLLGVGLSVSWIVYVVDAALDRHPSLIEVAVVSLAAPVLWIAGRPLVSSLVGTRERVLILGSGVVARRVVDVIRREPRYRLEIVGVLDDEPGESLGVPVIGRVRDLPWLLERTEVDRVVVAFSRISDHDVSDILRSCDKHGVELDVVPRLFDVVGPQPATRSLGGLPMLGVSGRSDKPVQRFLKRSSDFLVAGLLLLIASPVLIAIALAVKLGDGGPIFFRQVRVGQHGRLFHCLKFRTMVVDAEKLEADHAKLIKSGDADIEEVVRGLKGEGRDPRITRVGDILRRTSLDELPQLWNVLVGEMSLVGPRPLRPFEVEALKGWQMTRQSVRPGITGLWQVLGRSDIDWAERMQLDYDYARHWSLALDVEILFKTVRVVLLRRGAT